jgi:hypothetical protein
MTEPLLRSLLAALPVHRIRSGFYLVSSDLAELTEAEFSRLRFRAELALSPQAKRRLRRTQPTRVRLALLKAVLVQLPDRLPRPPHSETRQQVLSLSRRPRLAGAARGARR